MLLLPNFHYCMSSTLTVSEAEQMIVYIITTFAHQYFHSSGAGMCVKLYSWKPERPILFFYSWQRWYCKCEVTHPIMVWSACYFAPFLYWLCCPLLRWFHNTILNSNYLCCLKHSTVKLAVTSGIFACCHGSLPSWL